VLAGPVCTSGALVSPPVKPLLKGSCKCRRLHRVLAARAANTLLLLLPSLSFLHIFHFLLFVFSTSSFSASDCENFPKMFCDFLDSRKHLPLPFKTPCSYAVLNPLDPSPVVIPGWKDLGAVGSVLLSEDDVFKSLDFSSSNFPNKGLPSLAPCPNLQIYHDMFENLLKVDVVAPAPADAEISVVLSVRPKPNNPSLGNL